jgi:hypothetical protein
MQITYNVECQLCSNKSKQSGYFNLVCLGCSHSSTGDNENLQSKPDRFIADKYLANENVYDKMK